MSSAHLSMKTLHSLYTITKYIPEPNGTQCANTQMTETIYGNYCDVHVVFFSLSNVSSVNMGLLWFNLWGTTILSGFLFKPLRLLSH